VSHFAPRSEIKKNYGYNNGEAIQGSSPLRDNFIPEGQSSLLYAPRGENINRPLLLRDKNRNIDFINGQWIFKNWIIARNCDKINFPPFSGLYN
jgi:hypothetical protein